MMYRAIGILALLVAAFWLGSDAAYAENRLALVIGNSEYRTVTALPNPANDAKAMADLLKAAKFDVTEAPNLGQSEMRRAIRDFAAKAAQAGPETVLLLFYAGHGLQVDGENYLVPVDANIQREADLPIEAIRLHDVMNILEAVPSITSIVILDACRNNPFSEINKTIGRGLAIVDAPKGTIVSYSTSPGATALDGAGEHSPFTAALLDVARRPGVPVEQTFKNVRIAVHNTTHGQQTPWESTSLTANFVFFPGSALAKADEKTKPRTVVEWKREIEKLAPAEAFEQVLGADVVQAYEAYVDVFPAPPFGPRARGILSRRQEMIAWNLAVTLNSAASFQTFLESYPNSDLAATAQRLLKRAKNRQAVLGPQALARAISVNPANNNAAPQVKVVEKIVEVPKIVEKIVKVPEVRVVEKVVKVPQVKVVEKVVKVRYCPEPKRRSRHTRRHRRDDDEQVLDRPERPVFAPTIRFGTGFGIPFGGRRGHHNE
jgi:Caspase domain